MKSTDTILGAFAVMGFVLLGVFAFAGSTTDSVIDTEELNEADEELLVESNEVEVIELSNEDDLELALVDQENDQLDILTDELIKRDLIADLSPESIRTGVANFLQNGNPETRQEVLNAVGMADTTELIVSDNTTDNSEIVVTEVDTVDTQETEVVVNTQPDQEVQISDDNDGNEEDESAEIDEETELAVETTKEPGRVSRFFNNLFNGRNNSDVGGSAEDTIDEEDDADSENLDENVAEVEGSYVVKTGDNLWDILRAEGFSNGQAADNINDLRGDTSEMNTVGISSGSVDLIFPGQVLNL